MSENGPRPNDNLASGVAPAPSRASTSTSSDTPSSVRSLRNASAASAWPNAVTEREKIWLFVLLSALFVGLSVFTVFAWQRESRFYDDILTKASSTTCKENLMAFQVAIAPFRSLSMVRLAALFLSFVLVLLGSLFVLTGIEVAYRLSAELHEKKAALETASPGLVLVTAGALLVAASLYRSGSPDFHPLVNCGAPQVGADITNVLNPERGAK